MFALTVSFRVKAEKRAVFMAAAEDNSRSSLRDEPGCLRFDVLVDGSDAGHVLFYEVYESEAAFRAHQQSTHYPRWKETSRACLEQPQLNTRFDTVFPDPYR